LVYVAIVEYAHPTQGKLFVKVQNGYELDELHNVAAQSPSNGQTLVYNSSNSLWEAATIVTGGGPITQNADVITTNQTISAGSNALSVGPMTINTGVTVTVATGQTYVVL
jgi:hypothetical protein